VPKKKKQRQTFGPNPETPIGLIWDGINYSCAYDSFFTILCEMWIYNPVKWTKLFNSYSKNMERLSAGYKEALRGIISLEVVRNCRNTRLPEPERLSVGFRSLALSLRSNKENRVKGFF
jgi:hypothetical protein